MLKYRLIFGILMLAGFIGLLVLDGYLDGSLTEGMANNGIQGSILAVIVMLLAVPAITRTVGSARVAGRHRSCRGGYPPVPDRARPGCSQA